MSDNNNMPEENAPEENANSAFALQTLERFLEEDGWHPTPLNDRPIFRMRFAGKNTELVCYAQINMDLEQFLFYVVSPIKVPEELRMSVAEYLTKANYGLRIGNFEMDYADGEVRYKSSLDFEDVELNDPLIRHAIYPALHTMDRYFPGLMRVVYGGRSPTEAIQEIEGKSSEN
jgi:hypothetical protein